MCVPQNWTRTHGGRQEWVIAGGRVYEGDKCRWENTIKNVCSLYNDEQFSQSKFWTIVVMIVEF